MNAKISVIIPTLNESLALENTLQKALRFGPHEIIIADGGSTDDTLRIAEKAGVKIISSASGRAAQMNAAAKQAAGDILLFLHADTIMSPQGYEKMVEVMADASIIGGAFGLTIRSPKLSLQLISWVSTLRSKYLHIVYGDQAMFVRAGIFRKMHGFDIIPICEDLDFFRRLKNQGRVVILEEKASTSPRRWLHEGVLFTTLRNWLIAVLFVLGFPPRILSKWYTAIR